MPIRHMVDPNTYFRMIAGDVRPMYYEVRRPDADEIIAPRRWPKAGKAHDDGRRFSSSCGRVNSTAAAFRRQG